ncbi:putative toxin-antitoxin system toxin component, PIN family [Mitsuaria sp. GD03876]|uniref:putative toxin-antitoxin system toxin component, PIN family n=1 Tax=Mitsuaria sp. GD03876 TaxID=2975399 RepID=UPI0024486E76|nr:putative toxin-antitoxin system toxin component, PIN family [Mitsuaria sp. GD03876]MDH0863757.1 putative toxin-antitoxin system toxin component, PIN family [Mitsuaria sp. GD03876]
MQSEQSNAVRLVLDTNTVVSALIYSGPVTQLVKLATTGSIAVTLVSSVLLLAELRRVISKRKFSKKFAEIGRTADDILAEYERMSTLVLPTPIPPTVLHDPPDDVVLATAFACRAHLLVSGDADLLRLGRFRCVPIVTAAAAISMLGGPPLRRRTRHRPPPKGGTPPPRL